ERIKAIIDVPTAEKETVLAKGARKDHIDFQHALAELAELNRGTAYDILKKLQELGLVAFYHQDTKQRFVAEDPEKLLKILKEQEAELKSAKEKFSELIPELKSLQDKDGNRPVTKFYEGSAGIKFILDDVLSSMKDLDKYFVYSSEGIREDVYAAFPEFNNKRIKQGITAKTISLSAGGGTYGLDERKWLKASTATEENMTYIIIYADKCAFIARDSSNNPVGVIIENKMIYETQKTIFKQLWGLLN
ncbi:MAG: Transcriptional regulator, TrmB, partial [Candidatus Falkowbacteria bacterium GW2011_GWF2_39_8]